MQNDSIVKAKIADLIPDNLNANKGTANGKVLVEKSLRQFGAGRSILLDKNNRIIAGNKTVENATAIGMKNVLIVETDGNTIVAVKRTDIDLDSKKGRELAIADNASAIANIEWDELNLAEIEDFYGVDKLEWDIPDFDTPEPEPEPEKKPKKVISTKLIVECGEAEKLSSLFYELQERGFTVNLK